MTSFDSPSATQRDDLSQFFDDLPCPDPLPEAVAAGVFGAALDGCHVPGEQEIRALTEEHAQEMVILLADQKHLERCLEQGIDPNSQRKPRNVARQLQLQERLTKEIDQFAERYEGCVGTYADAFGYAASEQLDAAVQDFVAIDSKQAHRAVQRNLF